MVMGVINQQESTALTLSPVQFNDVDVFMSQRAVHPPTKSHGNPQVSPSPTFDTQQGDVQEYGMEEELCSRLGSGYPVKDEPDIRKKTKRARDSYSFDTMEIGASAHSIVEATDKAGEEARLMAHAEKKAIGKRDVSTQRPPVLLAGVNTVATLVEEKKAQLVKWWKTPRFASPHSRASPGRPVEQKHSLSGHTRSTQTFASFVTVPLTWIKSSRTLLLVILARNLMVPGCRLTES
ncbi:hypothetical protein U0070_020264 [Myodes glareolus]|uniref:Uncharacterized protein n=1 Tax=Myodes glareolus TaxID=447135 RepID=A0AAW0JE02_MYOGA